MSNWYKTLQEIRKIHHDTSMYIINTLESPEYIEAENTLFKALRRQEKGNGLTAPKPLATQDTANPPLLTKGDTE